MTITLEGTNVTGMQFNDVERQLVLNALKEYRHHLSELAAEEFAEDNNEASEAYDGMFEKVEEMITEIAK